MDKIDAVAGAPVYTSTTRPTGGNVYTGMEIFESDTKNVMVYDGSVWRFVGNGQSAWTTYTPTFGNITGGAGVFAYLIKDKCLKLRGSLSAGTATAAGICTITPPPGITIGVTQVLQCTQGRQVRAGIANQTGNILEFSNSDGSNFAAAAALVALRYNGEIEIS